MSSNTNSCLHLSFIILLTMLLSTAQVTNAGRQVPTVTKGTSVKQSKCITPTYSGDGSGRDGTTLPPSGGEDDTTSPPDLGDTDSGSEGSDSTTPTHSDSGRVTTSPPTYSGGSGGDDTTSPPSSGGDGGDGTTSPPDLGDSGNEGGDSTRPSSPRYIPGLDDTFTPNPGVEIPVPQSQQVHASSHP